MKLVQITIYLHNKKNVILTNIIDRNKDLPDKDQSHRIPKGNLRDASEYTTQKSDGLSINFLFENLAFCSESNSGGLIPS